MLQRCLVSDDPDLPKFKVEAVVPKFKIIASDTQLIRTLTILMELPSPAAVSTKEGVADTISIGMSLDEPDISSDTFKNLKRADAVDEPDSDSKAEDQNQKVIDFSEQPS